MDLPNEIIIELTQHCNLDCDFCFNKQKKNQFKDISKKDVFKVLEDISNSGIKAVRFTGGEPFLRKDLIEILKKAKSLDLYTILNTNATLINSSNKYCFRYADLTLFSFHNPGRFKMIKKKMDIIKDFNTKIMLGTIMVLSNIKNLKKYYEFVSKIQNKNFVEWFLLRPIPNINNMKPISKQQVTSLFHKLKKYNKKYSMKIKIANAIPFCVIKGDLFSVCKGGWWDSGYSRLLITNEGLYKTDYFSDKVLGSISKNKILDIWNLRSLRDIRAFKKADKKCRGCVYLKKCKGGMLEKEYLRDFRNLKTI